MFISCHVLECVALLFLYAAEKTNKCLEIKLHYIPQRRYQPHPFWKYCYLTMTVISVFIKRLLTTDVTVRAYWPMVPYNKTLHTERQFQWQNWGLLLVWINFNPSIRNYIHCSMWGWIIQPSPNFNCATAEEWGWISNIISHFARHVIIFHAGIKGKPCL